jgi:hypothetical protein
LCSPVGQPGEEQRGDHHLERVADSLAEDRAGRLHEVEHRNLAERDSGPETEAPEDQGGHADTHRGPQRRDAPVQIGKLQLCLGSKPVHRADPGNSAQIAQVAIHLVSGSQ